MKNPRSGLGAVLVVFSAFISISSQSLDTPANDACGKASQELSAASASDANYISAQTAYDCLIDVPFQKDDAIYTVQQLELYLQFYSAQTYFANPPTPELELSPVNLNQTMGDIKNNISSGNYKNEYSFNRDLFNLFGSYRDGHVAYSPLCYVAFIFQHDYPIISVAETPNSIPEIHVVETKPNGFEPGAKILQINGQNSVDYLTKMANSHPELTWVDPDARFNQLLMFSFGGYYRPGLFAARNVYPNEDLTLTWENGTTTKVDWYASLDRSISTDAFHSTDTFYKKVCIRPKKESLAVLKGYATVSWAGDASYIAENNDHQHPTKERRSEPNTARAIPQHHLLKRGGDPTVTVNRSITPPVLEMANGELSLYILDHETGVLVVNSFSAADESDTTTSRQESIFMTKFVSLATESISYLLQRGMTKVIIDISGNGGGFITLGENLAMQFFPKSAHFFGSNMRWNPAIEAMLTKGADPNATYWDLGHYHKMDGSDFASYQEFLGPVYRDNDYFTMIAIPDTAETLAEDGVNMPSSYAGPQPFDADNIVLLSSGMCASTCAVFAEAMLERGVHSVTFGGRPREGPMQTVGGIKGSQVLSFDLIAFWAYQLLGDVSKYNFIPGVLTAATTSASINLRNSWRKDDQKLPIEFIYAPSEHKLAYTGDMLTNQTVLWQATKDVVWGSAPDLCGGKCAPVTGGGLSYSTLGELIWLKIHGHSEL